MLVQVRQDFDSKIRRILGNLKASSDPNRAMLVQEELALMREEPCEPGSEADEREGGLGLQHRFVAGCSCAPTTAALNVLFDVAVLCCGCAAPSPFVLLLCICARDRVCFPATPYIVLVRAGASPSIWPRRRT